MKTRLKNTVLVGTLALFTVLTGLAQAQEGIFSDIGETHTHFTAIHFLHEQGVVEGYADGEYKPYEEITRAAALKLIFEGYDIHPAESVYKDCFLDVGTEWFAPYVCYAKEKGWVSGYEDGYFHPGEAISPPAALKVILEPLHADEIKNQSQEEIEEAIQDLQNVEPDYWAAPYIAFAKNKNLLHDSSSRYFGFNHNANRAKLAEYVFRNALRVNQGWDIYHPALRDAFLREEGSSHLLGEGALCHDLLPLQPDYFLDYLSSEYGTSGLYSWPSEMDQFPAVQGNEICLDETGKTIFHIALYKGKYLYEAHEIQFDEKQQLVEDLVVSIRNDNKYSIIEGVVYYRDVYEGDIPIPEIDAETFQVLEADPVWGFDSAHAYFAARIIEGSSGKSLDYIGGDFATDQEQVYFRSDLVSGADPESFEYLRHNFAKDKTNVYFREQVLEGADPSSFELVVGSFYSFAKDDDQVFYYDRELDMADAQSFEILDWGYAKDKNHVYYTEEILAEADPSHFKLELHWLPYVVGMDGTQLFCDGKLIGEASDFDQIDQKCHPVYGAPQSYKPSF